jgi:8-oxo-dGTP diphosphatase
MENLKRSVAGVAVEGGKLFIAKRVSGGAMSEKWEFPGGKVEEGESDEEALIREYLEEFGVNITVGPLLGSMSFEHRGPRYLYAYRITFCSRDFTLSEHTETKWAELAEIETLDFVDSDRALLDDALLGGAKNAR